MGRKSWCTICDEVMDQILANLMGFFLINSNFREKFYPNGMGSPSIMAQMLYIEGDKYLYHKSSQFGKLLKYLFFTYNLSLQIFFL